MNTARTADDARDLFSGFRRWAALARPGVVQSDTVFEYRGSRFAFGMPDRPDESPYVTLQDFNDATAGFLLGLEPGERLMIRSTLYYFVERLK